MAKYAGQANEAEGGQVFLYKLSMLLCVFLQVVLGQRAKGDVDGVALRTGKELGHC